MQPHHACAHTHTHTFHSLWTRPSSITLPELLGFFFFFLPCGCSSVAKSCLTLQPHKLQHARLSCPSPSPGVCSDSCPLSQWCHPSIFALSHLIYYWSPTLKVAVVSCSRKLHSHKLEWYLWDPAVQVSASVCPSANWRESRVLFIDMLTSWPMWEPRRCL